MKEYIDREAAIEFAKKAWAKGLNVIEYLEEVPTADVVEVKLLDDGTLVVTTDKYPHVNRVFVEDGKTSGSLFYAEE